MESSSISIENATNEITKLYGYLPRRPTIEQIEAAMKVIENVDKKLQEKLEVISKQVKGYNVSDELYNVLIDMQKNYAIYQSNEEKKESLKVLELNNALQVFDELIQRAANCIASLGLTTNQSSASFASFASNSSTNSSSLSLSNSAASSSSRCFEKDPTKASQLVTRDDTFLTKKTTNASFLTERVASRFRSGDSSTSQILDSSLKPTSNSGQDGEKLSLIKLVGLIESSLKNGTANLNLQGRLMEQIEWLPDSIEKLTKLTTLDLSDNRIATLPTTIGGLSSLTRLDLRSNKLTVLPTEIGDLRSLEFLDLRANDLTILPTSLGQLTNLRELDLNSNRLTILPESIGFLKNLKKLSVETNNIEEFPYTIGNCSALTELRADYNRIRALPEAVGSIKALEIVSVRYNNIRHLPTTMGSLENLRELDVSFNELESVPQNLGLANKIVRLNLSNNFADLQSLPGSIGNLEVLEELDISNNQIRVLPDTFRLLLRLRVLHMEGNPIEVPPRDIAELGAEAVVEYMDELFANHGVINQQPVGQSRRSWKEMCFCSKTPRRDQP